MAARGEGFHVRAGYRRSSIARHLWKTTALTSLALALSGAAAYGDDAGLWQPQVRAIIGADNNGGNAALEGFIPIKQTAESVLFLDVRAKHDFKDAFGQDIGLGIRRIVNPDLMLGGYAYFNAENYNSTQFSAATLGVEAITPNFDAHVNVFVPIKGDSTDHSASSTLSMVSNQLIEQISVLDHRDYAAWGIEGEVGAKVPLPLPDKHSLRLDIGGYHFEDPHGDDGSVTGAKAGIEYEIGDVFGTGTSLTFTGEVRNDNRDDTQFAGSVRLNIPFNPGGGSDTTAAIGADPVYPVSEGLRKRVNERVRGDIGVRIQSQELTGGSTTRVAINAATNAAFGKFYYADGTNNATGTGTLVDPTTLDNAVGQAGNGGFIVALGGKGDITTDGVTLATGQTVIGGGQSVTAKLFGGGTATFNLGGSDGTIHGTNVANNVIKLGTGNTLNGITITGGGDGIFGDGVAGTKLTNVTVTHVGGDGISGNNLTNTTLTNVTVTDAGGNGAAFTGNSSNVSASNFTATGNGLDGLHIEDDGTYNFTGTTLLQGNLDDGLDITGKGTYTFAIVNAQNNTDRGITVQGTAVGGSFTTTGGTVSGNGGMAVFIDPITAHVVLDSISQTGGTQGVHLDQVSGSFTVNGATTISNTSGPSISVSDSPATVRFGDIAITNPGNDAIAFNGVNAAVIAGNIVISGLGVGTGLDFSDSRTNFTAQSLNITGTGAAGSIGIDLSSPTIGAPATIIITNGGTISGVDTGVRLGIAGSLAHSANAEFTFGGTNSSITGVTASLDARGLSELSGHYAFGETEFFGPQLYDQRNYIFVAAGASGGGTSITDLASIDYADGITDSDAIIVLVNRGIIDDTTGFSLSAGQELASFGNGRTFSLGGVPMNVTGTNVHHDESISDSQGAATLTSSGGGDVLTLANDTSLYDFNISGGTGNGIHGSGVSNVTISGVSVSGAGLNGVLFDGTNTVSGSNLSSTGNGGAGLSIQGAGTYAFGGTTTLSSNTGDGLRINGNGTYGFGTLNADENGGSGVNATSTGAGMLSTTGGALFNNATSTFSATNIGLGVTLNSIGQTGGTTGISLSGVTGAFSVTGATTIVSTTGDGISISGSAATVGFSGDVFLTQPLGHGIALNGNSGAVSFGYAEVDQSGLSSIFVTNNTGPVSFGSVTIVGSAEDGFDVAGNAGSVTVSGTTNVIMGDADGKAGINFSGVNADVSFGTTNVTLGAGANQTGIDFSGSTTTADFGVTTIIGSGDITSRGIDLSSTQGNKTITFLRGSSISNVGIGVDLSSGLSTATTANANFTFGDGNAADGLQSSISGIVYTVNTVGLDPTKGNYDFTDVFFTGNANLAMAAVGTIMISQNGGVIAAGTNGLTADVVTITAADADAMTTSGLTFAFVGTVDLSSTPFTLDAGQSIVGFGNGASLTTAGTIQPVNVQGNLGATGATVSGDEGVVKSTGGDTLHMLGSNQVKDTAFDFTGGSGSVFTVDSSAASFDNSGGTVINGVTVSNVAVGQTAFKLDGTTGTIGNVSITNNNINVAGTLLDSNGGAGDITVTRGNLPNSGPAGTLTGGGISIANHTGGTVKFTDDVTIGGNGVTLTNNTGATITFADLDITTKGSTAFTATGGGTVNVATGTINATSAQAVALDGIVAGTTAADGIHFASTSATFISGTGIDLQNLKGTADFGTGTLTNTGSGTSFNVGSASAASGGNADISYGGTIATNGSGAAVSIQGMTGGSVTLSGDLTDNNAAEGGNIVVAGNDSAAIAFSGSSKVISSGATDGVSLGIVGNYPTGVPALNTNSTVDFTNGGLDVSTTTGTSFVAIGDLGPADATSTVITVTGAGNTINSGSDGLVVLGANVGSAGVTFDSISAVSRTPAFVGDPGGAGVTLSGANLVGDINIGGLRDTGYLGASLSALSGAGKVNFTGTIDLDVSYAGFDIGGPEVGTVNIANVAGSTLTIDGGQYGIIQTSQGGTVNVGVAGSASITNTTVAALSLGGGNDLAFTTLNYNGSVTIAAGAVLSASGDGTRLNMSGSINSTTASTAFNFVGHADGIYNISSSIDHSGGTGVSIGGSANGTVTFSGTSKKFNTGANDAVVKAPAYVPDPQTKGTLNFTNGGLVITTTGGTGFTASTFGPGTVSVTGDGNTITTTNGGTALKLGDATAVLPGATGATVGVDGIKFDTISANGAAIGISLNDVAGGTLDLGVVNLLGITGANARGVDISGTFGATLSFDSLNIVMAATATNAIGLDLNGAALGASAITAGDFDVDGGNSTGSLGIDMAGTTGTGTIQLGDTNTADNPGDPFSTIKNVARGVQFSSATDARLVFGDGAGPAASLISTFGNGRVIDATDSLPANGDYNFNDVNFSGDTSNLSPVKLFYIDAAGNTSGLGDGSFLNPGSVAQAELSSANVFVLVDKNSGGTETIDLGSGSFDLKDGQALISFKNGDAAIDVSQLGVDTGSGASAAFHFTTIQASTVVSNPGGLDTSSPILASSGAAATINLPTTGVGTITAGVQNVTVINNGSGAGILANAGSASNFVIRNNNITAGGNALNFSSSGVTADTLLASIDGNTFQSTGSGFGAAFFGTTVDADHNTSAIRSFANNTVIGGANSGGIVFNGVRFDADGAGGTVNAGTLTVGTPGARVQGFGINFTATSGTLDLGTFNVANDGQTGVLVNTKLVSTNFTLNSSGGSVDTTNGAAFDLDPLTVNMTIGSVTATGGASGIIFDGVAGTFTVNGATNISGTSGYGINATGIANTGTFNFNTVTVDNSGVGVTGGGVSVASGTFNAAGLVNIDTTSGVGVLGGGALNFNGGATIDTTTGTGIAAGSGSLSISATGGSEVNSTGGIAINMTSVNANIALNSTTSGGGVFNVAMSDVTGTVNLGTGALSGALGTSFLVSGGNAVVSYAGTITQATAAQRMISISNTTGGSVSLTTAVANGLNNSAADGTGILIDGAAGNVTIANASLTGARGITILGDTANHATGTYTFNNVAIDTGIGATNHAFVVDGDQGTPGNNFVSATINLNNVDITNPGGNVANIQGMGGGSVTFDAASTITRNDSGLGLLVTSNAGGTITFGGTTKTLTTGTNTAVTLSNNTNTTIDFSNGGLAINTSSGIGFSATGGGTIDVTGSGNSIQTAGGQILNWNGVAVGASGATFTSLQSTAAVTNLDAINLTNVSGGTFNGGAVSVAGTTTSGDGIEINGSSATFNFASATIAATAGNGILLSGANGAVTFTTVTIDNTALAGIRIDSNTNAVAVNGGSIGATNDPTGIGVDINGGTGNVTIAASVKKTTDGNIVEVSGRTAGTVTLSGSLSATGGFDNGIDVNGNSGTAVINFSNTSKVLNTGTHTAVSLVGNTNATINFTGGGLDIDTSSGIGFSATGGGTVTVQDTLNTINSTTGTALNVVNTTIGASGLTFRSISSSGAANGIVLNNTGTSGGLSVTGDGGGTNNGSGGTIQASTGDAISLTNTQDVHLAYMNITNNLGDGIGGSSINGFVLNRLNISGNGNDAATDESGINITELTGTASNGAHATSISNSVISNNNEFEIQISNSTGTLTNLQLVNNTISANGLAINGNASSPHGNLVNFLGTGSSTMGLTVTGGSFTGNTVSDPTHVITGTGVFGNSGGTSMTVNVSGATFTNNNAGVDVSTDPAATSLTFDIEGNTFIGQRSTAINHFDNGNAPFTRTVNGTIKNNIIGNDAVANSGSAIGNGISIQNEGAVNGKYLITGNTISQIATAAGISVNVGLGGSATGGGETDVTVTNNVIQHINGNRGIIIQDNQVTDIANPPGAGPFPTIWANVQGNSFASIAGAAGNGQYVRFKQSFGIFKVTQSAATAGAIAGELDDANGINDPTKFNISGTVSYSQGAAPLPTTNPLP
ncbi:right-handed parallel beta-helix repeat-containing protein [Mesorhizobium sp. B2-3-4]|uniref:right-handed parallel beta-helix repeat-containing protein n=1 Tax=Mesorhizobium sp. B2-3-4 TaxID=2589959 RepID=UPI001FEF5EEF|nr:right-handed parallel beta-helix repeat-containing protein [Mesorhizobium sp. B2-3-4]